MKVTYLPEHILSREGQSIMLRYMEVDEVLYSSVTIAYHCRDDKYFYSSPDGVTWKRDSWGYEKVMRTAGAYTIEGIVQ